MKLAVIGSRGFIGFTNYELLKSILNELHGKKPISLIISGGAIGADKMAEDWANENLVPTLIHLPDWNKYGKSAGYIRNQYIIRDCDAVLAFWDGESKGTKSSIDLAKKYEKPCKVIMYNKPKLMYNKTYY